MLILICFLLLHKKFCNKVITSNDGYVKDVKNAFALKKSDDIKDRAIIEDILSQITLDDVFYALHNCQKIEEEMKKTGTYITRCAGHYTQPFVKIHELIFKILEDNELC